MKRVVIVKVEREEGQALWEQGATLFLLGRSWANCEGSAVLMIEDTETGEMKPIETVPYKGQGY